ncbi:MAG: hypothetical protein HYY40_09915 [Bacteroidetes bacterium]|nr:hypothetical protein [Bacteroidota bacterium]
MRNFILNVVNITILLTATCFQPFYPCYSQQTSYAVINISVRGMIYEKDVLLNQIRKEMLKNSAIFVTDPWEVKAKLAMTEFDHTVCFDRECIAAAAKKTGVQKAVSGSVERIGERMLVNLTIIDAATGTLEKTSVGDYIYNVEYIDNIIGLAVKKLFDLAVDPQIEEVLSAHKDPVVNVYNTVHASGPRVGLTYITGFMGKRLGDPENRGGYDMSPLISQFGYQFESQYYSSGYMQTLIEVVFFVGGLERKTLIPTLAFLNGFRDAKSGYELALGPVFWLAARREGFYKGDTWLRVGTHDADSILTANPDQEYYYLPDKEGKLKPGYGLVVSAGKTFRSGNLNIPVNVYVIPQQHRKEGWEYGLSVGFNVKRK